MGSILRRASIITSWREVRLEEDRGIRIFLSLLVDCKFESLCQEHKINERNDYVL